MKDFFGSMRFKILVGLLAVLLGFMIAAVYTGGSASFFGNLVGIVTKPFQQVSASISYSVSQWFQKRTDAEALYEENLLLKEEIRSLREQLVDYDSLINENQQYARIVDTLEEHADWKIQPASVIARDPQSRFYSFTINRGTMDGINYMDPVMSSDGLVGYVSEVGMTYAKVLTILDVKVDVGAYASKSQDIGVVSGTVELAEKGMCTMDYLPRNTLIAEGDYILTSGSLTGGASIYPRGMMIGQVVRVEPDAHGTSPHAVLKPVTDIAEVKDVYVLTDFEGQGKS